MKLDFISQPSLNSTLPFAGLQHMQQCQVTFPQFKLSCFWSKLMVSTAGPGFEPKTSWTWIFTLTTRPLTFLNNQSDSDKGKLIVNSVSQPPFGPLFVCFSLIALFVNTFLPLLDHLGFLSFTGITDFWDVSYLNNNS